MNASSCFDKCIVFVKDEETSAYTFLTSRMLSLAVSLVEPLSPQQASS